MLSTEDLFYLQEDLLQHKVSNKVSASARLTFYMYENLFLGQETIVRCPHKWVSILSRFNLQKM